MEKLQTILKNTTKKDVFIFILLFVLLFSSTALFSQYQIGHTTITFQDANRNNRSIETEIYYPAATAGTNVAMASGQYPIIVFGHGFVMAWSAYENLWTEFVPRGYIMVFPRTEGSIIGTDHQKFGWDLQFLVHQMQLEGSTASSIFHNGVAPKTALMGHSMGGGAAFLAADSLVQSNTPYFNTLIGLAPAESTSNGVSSINSAKTVTVPSLVLSGAQDGVTPPVDHHIPMYDSLASSCKTFITIIGGGHCYFAEPNFNCDFGEGTSSTGISITRGDQHAVTFDFVNPWLDYTLKGDCDAFVEFNDSLQNSPRINHNQVCTPNPVPSITANGAILTSSTTGVSYQWYLDSNPIPNSNSVSITATASGNYEVEVFYTDGCSEISAPFILLVTNIEINNFKGNIIVYPNPTSSILNIEFSDSKVYVATIVDFLGKEVLKERIENRKIDISAVPSGIYMLQLQSEKLVYTTKVVKK